MLCVVKIYFESNSNPPNNQIPHFFLQSSSNFFIALTSLLKHSNLSKNSGAKNSYIHLTDTYTHTSLLFLLNYVLFSLSSSARNQSFYIAIEFYRPFSVDINRCCYVLSLLTFYHLCYNFCVVGMGERERQMRERERESSACMRNSSIGKKI
jgi:hypothetical protein